MERPVQHALASSRLLAPRERVAPRAPGGAQLLALDKAVHPLAAAEVELPLDTRSRRIVGSASKVGERPSVGPSRTPLRQSGRARTTPYAHGRSAPTAALRCDRNGSAQPGSLARARSRRRSYGSNKGLTGRSVQEGTAVEVQRPVRRARDGLQLHWQLPERVWSAAVV